MRTLFFVAAFFGFSSGMLTFTLSPYLYEVLQTHAFSFLYIVPEAVALIFFLWFLRLEHRTGRSAMLLCCIFLQIGALAALIRFDGTLASVFFVAGYLALLPFFMMSLDTLLVAASPKEKMGRNRGLYIFFFHLGFISGPLVSGFLLEWYGFSSVFFWALLCFILLFFLAVFGSVRLSIPKQRFPRSLHFLRFVKKHPDLARIYALSILLEGLYAMSAIVFPLHLMEEGLTPSQTGVVLMVMISPFLFLPFVSGKLADVLWGEKEMLLGAVVLAGATLLLMAIVSSQSVWVWAGLCFFTRVGASVMETMRDSYYYKSIDGRDAHLIVFFRTARSVGIIAAALGMFLLLAFTDSLRIVFLLFGFLLLASVFFISRIRDAHDPKQITVSL